MKPYLEADAATLSEHGIESGSDTEFFIGEIRLFISGIERAIFGEIELMERCRRWELESARDGRWNDANEWAADVKLHYHCAEMMSAILDMNAGEP